MGVGAGLYMCDVVKKFTFAISSPDEFLLRLLPRTVVIGFITHRLTRYTYTCCWLQLVLTTLYCLLMRMRMQYYHTILHKNWLSSSAIYWLVQRTLKHNVRRR